MDHELLSALKIITDEEYKLLEGGSVEKELYTGGRGFMVDKKRMLARGKTIDIRPHTRFVHFPKHTHNYIEIIYMCSGCTTHMINDTQKLVLKAGELLFLNQYASHEILPAGEEDIAVNFIVLPQFFDIALDMVEKDSILGSFLISTLKQDTSQSQYLHFKVAGIPPIQNLVENMVWSIIKKQGNARRINQLTMGLLFVNLLNHTDKIEYGTANGYESRLAASALQYIEEQYKAASLTELATQLSLTASTLSRIIKAATGCTFKTVLQRKRLSRAAQLLSATSLPVLDIITAVGYDNTSYFYRIFRQEYGISPKEYRKELIDKSNI